MDIEALKKSVAQDVLSALRLLFVEKGIDILDNFEILTRTEHRSSNASVDIELD